MRSRSRMKPLLAAFAIAGGALGAAGAANATTVPPGTEPAGTEAPNPLAGTTVTVFGVETATEGPAFQVALNTFADANGMTITYSGSRGFEAELGTMVEGGSPPDIAIIPQPGRIAGYAASGDALALPDDVAATAEANMPESVLSRYVFDDALYALPFKADLKSLVWYLPAVFAEKGYEVPTTYDEFIALTEQMIANGDTPLCVGIEAEAATGWPFTDWTELTVLRDQGLDYYNQWATHEIPFNSPEIVAAMQEVIDLWNTDGMAYAEGGDIAATDFRDNGIPLVDGDCMMHRQANFYAAFFPEGTEYGDGEGQVNTFYFPGNEGRPTLTGGNAATAFRDAPEVWAVMQYLATPEFANARQEAQAALSPGGITGYLTSTAGVDTSLWGPLEKNFIEILLDADPLAFDASDLMPTVVQSAFWANSTSLVNGDVTAQEAADAIEASWPTS